MTHPMLSVSEICTYPLPLAEELALWDELEVRNVGLLARKLDQFGRDAAVAAIKERGLRAVTIVAAAFDLANPDSWDQTRNSLRGTVDLAAELGGCVYFTPGRRFGHRSFDELTDALAAAVAPCLSYAGDRGVILAIEPSLRADLSFVHTLRDGLDVAERAGIHVIADLGNCWMERDVETTLRRAGARVAAVQFADAVYGSPGNLSPSNPPPGGRAVPGDGDLAIDGFLRAALDAGYRGPFELELAGPRIEQEGHTAATRRAVERASALLEKVLA